MHRLALIILGCALGLATVQITSAKPSDQMAPQPLADKHLPLTAKFEKATSGENKGVSVMHLKNDSKHAVTVSTTIVPSVTFHANAKTRTLPEQVIGAGKTWTVADLGVGDKITLTAAGFAPLVLTVP